MSRAVTPSASHHVALSRLVVTACRRKEVCIARQVVRRAERCFGAKCCAVLARREEACHHAFMLPSLSPFNVIPHPSDVSPPVLSPRRRKHGPRRRMFGSSVFPITQVTISHCHLPAPCLAACVSQRELLPGGGASLGGRCLIHAHDPHQKHLRLLHQLKAWPFFFLFTFINK